MYRKLCPECKTYSYSASKNSWFCPNCEHDLSEIRPYLVNRKKKSIRQKADAKF